MARFVANSNLNSSDDNSWKNQAVRESLMMYLENTLVGRHKQVVDSERQRIAEYESQIREFTRNLKLINDSRTRAMQSLQTSEKVTATMKEKVVKELDQIANHEKVKDVIIHNRGYTVYTHPLYCHHDITGERYYLGEMTIDLRPERTDVRFYGSNGRRSYWTAHDPHPHVNGDDGIACLGNLSPTIAQLCSEMELYALTMVCIEFLESVNTSDIAGANIRNWDKVDKDGNIIQAPNLFEEEEEREYDWHCDHCEEGRYDGDEGYTVYTSYEGASNGQGHWGNEIYVCNECAHEYYEYEEVLGEYVRIDRCNIEEDEEELTVEVATGEGLTYDTFLYEVEQANPTREIM